MNNDFKVTKKGTALVVELGRSLNTANAPELQDELATYVGQDIEKVVFDASELLTLSSSGLRVVYFSKQRLGNKPEIVFVNCAKDIYNVLDLVGMTTFIKFKEDQQKREQYRQRALSDLSLGEVLERSTNRKKDLEQFAANNDVVCYSMKMGEEDS